MLPLGSSLKPKSSAIFSADWVRRSFPSALPLSRFLGAGHVEDRIEPTSTGGSLGLASYAGPEASSTRAAVTHMTRPTPLSRIRHVLGRAKKGRSRRAP